MNDFLPSYYKDALNCLLGETLVGFIAHDFFVLFC